MKAAILFGAMLVVFAEVARAQQPLLFEGFEAYQRNILDANVSGPNEGPNGGPGNPWWGEYPPDLRVVGTDTNVVAGIITNIVTPHGGTNMVRGIKSGAADFDRDFLNLACRVNQSKAIYGNVALDWWFFDPVGANTNAAAAPQYQDHLSLAYWTGVPSNTDYGPNADPGLVRGQLSLGAASSEVSGYKATNYQAQILNTVAGGTYDAANGWFNLPVARSVGWHHARIALAPALANGTASVTFYIDNLGNALLTNNSASTNGFNCLQLECEYNGSVTGYFDDITMSNGLPTLSLAMSGAGAILSWPGTNWTLQSTTNTQPITNFVDVVGAASPYTNAVGGAAKFFRLKQ